MVRKEPVSVNWQTLLAIMPIFGLWATYRIEKLRLYFIIIFGIASIMIIFGIATFGYDVVLSDEGAPSDRIFLIIEISVSIFLVRKWSKEWNEKVAKTDLPNEKFCSKCGTKLLEDSNFCSKCGNVQQSPKN